MIRSSIFFTVLIALFACTKTPPATEVGIISEAIRINQIGYYPKATKKVIVATVTKVDSFSIIDVNSNEEIYRARLSKPEKWDLAGETVKIGDFSTISTEGSYKIYVEGLGYSYPFTIKQNVLRDALIGSVKALYYQRAGVALEEKYAGQWQRPAGHPDDSVVYHPSSGKSEGYTSSPGGWYDAGDYNKYVVNGAFPLGQYFQLYEQYAELTEGIKTNIPNNNPALSNYLEELKFELDWLLTMQDNDGGLFHKLTTKNFEGMVMPHKATNTRFIVGKGTAATLDFAACAAQASRVFSSYDSAYAARCLEAAKRAWGWSMSNPVIAFRNPNDVHTGQYGDDDFKDEWYWAAAELFVSTGSQEYLTYLTEHSPSFQFNAGESWNGFMRFLGMMSLLERPEVIPDDLYDTLKNGLIKSADELVQLTYDGPYFQPVRDFRWGSNSDLMNACVVMAGAYRLTENKKYLDAVRQTVDYIFGKNAVGYSFLTGFGEKSPQFIHHRQSAADKITAPVHGLLSGGPNASQQDVNDGAIYPENVAPMQSWVDQEPSFASNEICLNWNAPLTYILGFLEAEGRQ